MSDEPTTDAPADIITSAGAGSLKAAGDRRRERAELHTRKQELNTELKDVAERAAELDELLQEDYAELGTNTARAKLPDGREFTVSLEPELRGSPVKTGINDKGEDEATDEDWAKACEAMRAAGWGDLVREQFNSNSLSKRLRELRDEHGPDWRDELPDEFDGAIKVTAGTRVSVRKVPGT